MTSNSQPSQSSFRSLMRDRLTKKNTTDIKKKRSAGSDSVRIPSGGEQGGEEEQGRERERGERVRECRARACRQ
jgi:hypothetical protein